MKATIYVFYDNCQWWEHKVDTTTNAEWEELADFAQYDKLADGFKWGMSVKGFKQRKLHAKSLIANSIYAMLDNVKDELKKDCYALVVCHTPDVEINFCVG